MTVKEFAEKSGMKILNMADGDTEITGVYCGDLLSWVIGRAEEGNIWLTIMSNVNVAAVSVMTDLACIVLCEDVKPDDSLLQKVQLEKVNLFMSTSSVYNTAVQISSLLSE